MLGLRRYGCWRQARDQGRGVIALALDRGIRVALGESGCRGKRAAHLWRPTAQVGAKRLSESVAFRVVQPGGGFNAGSMRREPVTASAGRNLLRPGKPGQFFGSAGGGRSGIVAESVCGVGGRAAVARLSAEGQTAGAISGAAFGR